ncbi:GNAT family N-acetyltransferase [Ornithinibacillus sp. L9]|uniref:GNAT family N-acetyltransferase n=1 Tax=Ornithinibacillus caprae TaxID=2678566 RepID=A0A6N8FPC4_9BACI|nr:GNAT family N-acetyltransferase [Ornithinibacillus caprae]MUK90786.1 GNAT family N-acetyltransferase [Ornithinibacillus caprae]
MIKTLHIEKDYQDIFALSQFAFQYKLTEDELDQKRKEGLRHKIWGYMDGDNIAAKLHLIPLTCFIGGKEIKMGGISSVATWPEYRRGGMVKELLGHALKHMKKNGQVISYLHPFSVPFYRKFGWELVFNEKAYTIPIEKFKKKWDGNGYVRRITPDYQVLNDIYTEYAKTYTGTLLRDEKWWEQRIVKDDMHIAIAYNKSGEPEGYIIFQVKDKEFTVIDKAYRSLNGRVLLLQFVANHDSMVEKVKMVVPENDNLPLLIDDPRFEQKIEPYFMARIVDVHEFLKQYPYEVNSDGQVVAIHVTDSFLPENNGVYHIKRVKNESTVSFIRSEKISTKGVTCSVQQLASMFFGYNRPMELFALGLLQGSEEDVLKLEKLIPIQQSYFADFF